MESPSIALECFEPLTLIGDFFLPYIVNSSAEEGWPRPQENIAKLPFGAAGVVLVKRRDRLKSVPIPAPPRLRELWSLRDFL